MDLVSWLAAIVLGATIALMLSSLTGRPLWPPSVPNLVAIFVLLATYALLAAIKVAPALFIANVLAVLAWFFTDRMRKRFDIS